MALVIGKEVVDDTNGCERTSNGVNDENGGNEKAKDLVGKLGTVGDNLVEIDEGGNNHVDAHPKADPRVECKERNIQSLRH